MDETGDSSREFVNGAVRDSLRTIREAHARLHLLTSMCMTASAIASQIEIFDVLLAEIRDIQIKLARDIQHTRVMPEGTGLNA